METRKFPALDKKDTQRYTNKKVENVKSNQNAALCVMLLFMLNRRFEIKQIKTACHLERTELQARAIERTKERTEN